ncbi:MAG TPA: rhodanese-like domain-containing protein [Burkholderiaceae bacterium]
MNFIIDNIILVGLVVVSGAMLMLPALQRRGKKVTPLQATLMINKDKATIVDVRGSDEFAAGHLRDAKNIPLADLATRAAELDKAKSKPVIVVCQTGVRSAKAAAQLEKAGFTEAYSLDGGVAAWSSGGLPLTRA